MNYRKIGKTDLAVSVVAMGCWAIVGDETWGVQDEADGIAAIHTALDLGVNFFDTAEGYGNGYSEELLARGIKGQRHEVVIATKVSSNHLNPPDVIQACEDSLRRLRTDYIDLYQIHWPGRTVAFAETMGALKQLQAQGKIRAIGVSNFGPLDLNEITQPGRCEANQIPYSLLWRAIEFEIQPICVDRQISILPYSPLAQGLLTGKFKSADEVPAGRARTRFYSSAHRELARHGEPGCEKETFEALAQIRQICQKNHISMAAAALSWLLYQPGVTSVLAGARNAEQMRQNVVAAELMLPDELIQQLSAATAEVKTILGTNPDMWQSTGTSRYR